jgi:hypothetical protein
MALVGSPETGRLSRSSARAHGGLLGVAALLGVIAVPTSVAPAAEPAGKLTHEYDLKAVFLFHFASFVDWPAAAFPDRRTPLTIGILGEDPFGKSLDEIVANETVVNETMGARKLAVRRFRSAHEIEGCHILFVCSAEGGRWDAALGSLHRRHVLTVGETKDFAARSGIIGFVVSQNRLKLQINLSAAQSARLTISSKLLRQAEVVHRQGS